MTSHRNGNKSSKYSASLSGFSFKALEEEEDDDEDLTVFTGKFDKIVEEAHKHKTHVESQPPVINTDTSISKQKAQKSTSEPLPPPATATAKQKAQKVTSEPLPPPLATTTESNLSKLHNTCKSVDDDRSSPSKKNKSSVFEYKEYITGLKERITDTKDKITESINKKLEGFSTDASPTSESTKNILETAIDHPLNPSIVDNLTDSEDEIDNKPAEDDEKAHATSDASLDLNNGSTEDGNDAIEVIESYFGDEPLEDFTGEVGISLRGTATKTKSKNIRKIVKKTHPKSSAKVSLSNLISIPDDDLSVEGTTISENEDDKEPNTNNQQHKAKILRQLSSDYSVPWQSILSISIVVFAFLIIPLPSYISGLVMGAILASGGWCFYLWLMESPVTKLPMKITPLEDLPKFEVPEMKEPHQESGVYKGWLNELMEYRVDDYHINQTHSVFVVLEGTHLRLQRPKVSMPKRAMWDEVLPPPKFIHQRHIDLKDSRIFLMPPGLVKKRLWSKKYPICIALTEKGYTSGKSSDMNKKTGSPVEDLGFEVVTEDKCSSSILYLFARTGPEKEMWFKRILAASMGKPLGNHILDINKALSFTSKLTRKPSDSSIKHKRQSSNDSISSLSSVPETPPSGSLTGDTFSQYQHIQSFAQYMGRLMPSECKPMSPSRLSHFNHDPSDIRQISGSLICDPQLIWLNSLIGRCFWDFLRDQWWSEKVREKLQKKLSKIHVPYFIETLQVSHIDMGCNIPIIRRAGKPYIDEQGLWIDLDIVYNGGFQMTIETKVNLMKLQKKPTVLSSEVDPSSQCSPVTDSNEEDSAESSTDEEEDSQFSATTNDGSQASGGGSRKFLKYIDKIAQSKYFQQAYEYKYFKKALEGVSNTPLVLTVEVNSLIGCLAINIPPPSSDRLWYGFRGNPTLSLTAKPKVGEREVTITHVTDWIEKKLSTEFQRVFVMPNMDDLEIPILLADVPADIVPLIRESNSSTPV